MRRKKGKSSIGGWVRGSFYPHNETSRARRVNAELKYKILHFRAVLCHIGRVAECRLRYGPTPLWSSYGKNKFYVPQKSYKET